VDGERRNLEIDEQLLRDRRKVSKPTFLILTRSFIDISQLLKNIQLLNTYRELWCMRT
jgi:hypothetical protein